MTQDQLIAEQDRQRTARSFISFLSTVTGGDQSYASEDGNAVNFPGQYQTVTPAGVSVEGRPISNQQQTVTITLPMLMMVAVVAFLVLK